VENCRECPTVLGTKPTMGPDLWSFPVGEDRVLVIKNGSMADDSIWFLEVRFLMY